MRLCNFSNFKITKIHSKKIKDVYFTYQTKNFLNLFYVYFIIKQIL